MSSSDAGAANGNGSANSSCSSSKNTDVSSDPPLPFVLVNFIPIPAGNNKGASVNDLDGFIEYSAGWDIKVVPQEGKPSPGHTEHSTAVVGSSIRYTFNGTQVLVLGLLPPGDGPISATYSVDGGPPLINNQATLDGPSLPLGNQTFFTSNVLPYGEHVVEVNVTQTGQGRNYTFDYFEVITPSSAPSVVATPGAKRKGANVGAIVGGVIGGVAFLVIMVLVSIILLRRRPGGRRVAANLPIYRQSMKASSTDAIEPFIPPSSPEKRYRSDPKLAPQMRLSNVESLTLRGDRTISSIGGTYSETVSSTLSPVSNGSDPRMDVHDTDSRIERKLLPPLPRYTSQSIINTLHSSRVSAGSGDVSDFTHFTAARASSALASPILPSPTAVVIRRSAASSNAAEV